ncbi:hypothetical protein ACOSQ3_005038 [Xanthoceras sorbifolium]
MDAALLAYKSLPDISNIESFNEIHFKRWQEKVTNTFDVLNFVEYLTKLKREEGSENYTESLEAWNKGNKVLGVSLGTARRLEFLVQNRDFLAGSIATWPSRPMVALC